MHSHLTKGYYFISIYPRGIPMAFDVTGQAQTAKGWDRVGLEKVYHRLACVFVDDGHCYYFRQASLFGIKHTTIYDVLSV